MKLIISHLVDKFISFFKKLKIPKKNSRYFAKKNSTKLEKTQATGGLGHCVLQVYVQKKSLI